jgi:hypothetical protein
MAMKFREFARCQPCDGKVIYTSYAEARAARELMVGRDRLREEIRLKKLAIYTCPENRAHYHLGRRLDQAAHNMRRK